MVAVARRADDVDMRLIALLVVLLPILLTRIGTSFAEEPALTRELSIAEPIEFPPDTAMIVQTGCTNCDGGFGLPYRIYRLGTGPVRIEPVVMSDGLTAYRMVTSFVSVPGAGLMFFGACVGPCDMWTMWPLGGTRFEDQPNETVFFRSDDGGVTWVDVGRQPGWLTALGVLEDEVVYSKLRSTYPTFGHPWELWTASGRALGQAAVPFVVNNHGPFFEFDIDRKMMRGHAGEDLVAVPGADTWPQVFSRPGASPIASWYAVQGPSTRPIHRLAARTTSGRTLVLDSKVEFSIGASFNERFVIANLFLPDPMTGRLPSRLGYAPALLDFDAAIAYPIGAPFGQAPWGESPFSGTNRIEAVWRGPFLRVATPECLPLRAWADAFASVTACAAPGVLLRLTGGVRYEHGVEWREATMPNGTTGWVPRGSVEG
jgi:hypothetical protein